MCHAQNVNNNGQLDNLEEVSTKYTFPITMPDGISLMTDFYLPILRDSLLVTVDVPLVGNIPIQILPKNRPFIIYDSLNGQINPNPYKLPLIFSRTPYNKGSWDGVATPVNILGYGYAVQDMRGRYTSEGVYLPLYSDGWSKDPYHPNYGHVLDVTELNDARNGNKHEDGYNSVMDLINRNWQYDLDLNGVPETTDLISTGRIGMFGASALGYNQYQAAAAHKINPNNPGLKCLVPIVATQEFFKSTGFQNGVFRDQLVNGWLKGQIFTGTDDDLNAIDNDIDNNMHSATDYGLPNKFEAASKAINHFASVQYQNSPAGYYPNSVGRGDMDATHAPVNAQGEGDINGQNSRYTNMEVPAFHLTGWWDIFIDGQIETWNLLRQHLDPNKKNKYLQKLVIGPWAHQTIGSRTTGDITYKENIADILGFGLDDFSEASLPIEKAIKSEMISWYRYNLNYDSTQFIGEPKAFIKQSDSWSSFGIFEVRVPAENYKVPINTLVNFLTGASVLPNFKIGVRDIFTMQEQVITLDIPATGTPLIPGIGDDAIDGVQYVDFLEKPDVRFYVVGPVEDGIAENDNVGNYWYSGNEFPLTNGINWTQYFLHKNGTLNTTPPQTNEGFNLYIHDPNDPIRTIGGGNMIVKTPDGQRDSQGQFDLTEWAEYTMDRPGVIKFETETFNDTLCMVGFPKAKIYAKSNPAGVTEGPTDTDFFVRIVDVYPTGEEYFVVEGCVNARGKEYARSIYNGQENDNAVFDNINIGQIYEYEFQMLPIAYTFGKGHRMKVLISSSNYTRYQVNPNLPIMPGEFFRRRPGDGQTYVYQGVEMAPRVAINRVAFAPEYPTQIILPILNQEIVGLDNTNDENNAEKEMIVFPNPTQESATIALSNFGNYRIRLCDVSGKTMQSFAFLGNETMLNMANFGSGLYIVTVEDLMTGKQYTQRLVKR
jgi:predicted acyl esterase